MPYVSPVVENDFKDRLNKCVDIIKNSSIKYQSFGIFGSYARNDYKASSDIDLVLCQDLVQVKMSFSHSNLPAIPKLPVDTILQNHRVTYNRNDYEFVWYYKTFPSIQIPGGMHVCNC